MRFSCWAFFVSLLGFARFARAFFWVFLMSALISELVKSISHHPIFALLIAAVLAAFITYSYNTYATIQYVGVVESRVEDVDRRVFSLRATIERNALESKIHTLEAEIFGLERLVESGAARDMDYSRLAKLRSELGTAKRNLSFIPSSK